MPERLASLDRRAVAATHRPAEQRVEPDQRRSLLEVDPRRRRARLLARSPASGRQLAPTFRSRSATSPSFPRRASWSATPASFRVHQSGERADRSALPGRVALVALGCGRGRAARRREQIPWHRLYVDVRARHGNGNAAKSAVARKVLRGLARVVAPATLQACRRLRGGFPCPGKLQPASGRLTARLRIECRDSSDRNDAPPEPERELSTNPASPEHGGTRTDRGQRHSIQREGWLTLGLNPPAAGLGAGR